jgi:hypothetical protein
MARERRRLRGGFVVLLTALSFPAREASAQESVKDVLSFLVTNQAVVTDDFVKDREAAAATGETVSQFLQVALAALPVSSSTGGFVYRFNPSVGTMERASDSFGLFFLDRALTSGRRQTSIGVTYRYAQFDTLDGRSLRDGTLVTTANRLTGEPAPFDVEALELKLDAATVTMFGSYGVTDRLDISAAMPVVDLSLSGERLNVYRGSVFQQATASAFVTGIGDISLRAKYALVQTREIGVAADVDLRLPTGNEDQLLGAGSTAVRLSAIASLEGPRVATHVKGGIGLGGASDEVALGAAVALAVTSRFSLVGEVFGQRLSELARIADVAAPHPSIPNVSTTRLLPADTGTNTAVAVAGFKWNVARTWLLNANVLFPLTDTGLTSRPIPSIALEYTFDRK